MSTDGEASGATRHRAASALLDTVRAACPTGLWSKGSELVRSGAVAGIERSEDTWTFRVRTGAHKVAPTVSLFPLDDDWECDCDGRFDVCEHAAACAIAAAQTPGALDDLFAEDAGGAWIAYALYRSGSDLLIARSLRDATGTETPIERPISDPSGRRMLGGDFAPTHADLQVDMLLGRSAGDPVDPANYPSLLRALVTARDVTLDGEPVETSNEPLYPQARVVDAERGGVELIVDAGPDVSEIVLPGILRSGSKLHPAGQARGMSLGWSRLPFRKRFEPNEIAELVGKTLPELERHITVDIRTNRLPDRAGSTPPWIRMDVDVLDTEIEVFPLLVYGDPPNARVDSGKLVHLDGPVPARDEAAEKRLVLRLRDELNLAPGRRVRFSSTEAARFLSSLESFDDGRPGSRAGTDVIDKRAPLVPGIDVSDDGFELRFESEDGSSGASASAEAVLAAWRSGVGLVPLGDGGFAPVPASWLARHGHLVEDLLAAKRANDGDLPKAAFPIVGELCEALDEPTPFDTTELRSLVAQTGDETALPADFRGELRHYQETGVAWLNRLRRAGMGAVLADDMGLGKTVQALCALDGRSLVVCPRSVIHNWRNEAEKFRPGLSVNLFHGPSRSLETADLTITTYATLRNDIDALAEVTWDTLVMDEAQAIKNPSSQTARTAYRLEAEFRISLSGTPVENRLDELWSQMHFTNRGLLGGRRGFAERFERPILEGDGVVAERLQRRIRPFVMRRLKREVASELPPRTDSVLYCELEPDERDTYDAVRSAARTDVAEQLDAGGVLAALEALLRLRQAACHPGLLPGRSATTSSKIDALTDALDDVVADTHKALVFSQWTGLLDLVEPHLAEHRIAYTRLDGSTRNREEVVESFQSDDGPPVMLISLKAGGTGLNLTAADHVFLLDPWWNPAVEDQAADRAHRIGQDRPVFVYRLVAKDTVEERVLALQERKRAIADAALSATAGGAAATITRDDIMALLD